jgi:hypothetical protein
MVSEIGNDKLCVEIPHKLVVAIYVVCLWLLSSCYLPLCWFWVEFASKLFLLYCFQSLTFSLSLSKRHHKSQDLACSFPVGNLFSVRLLRAPISFDNLNPDELPIVFVISL